MALESHRSPGRRFGRLFPTASTSLDSAVLATPRRCRAVASRHKGQRRELAAPFAAGDSAPCPAIDGSSRALGRAPIAACLGSVERRVLTDAADVATIVDDELP